MFARWTFTALLLLSCAKQNVRAAEEEPVKWLTGTSFLKEWDSTLSVSWSDENPLRPALERLARRQRMAIMLDRRVDPDQFVAIRTGDVTFGEFAQRLATQLSLGVCRVGSVIYLGPSSTTDRLPAVAALRRDELSKSKASLKERLRTPKTMQWPRLAEPRELVKELAAEAGCEVDKLTSIVPHDLWPATQLPPLAWSDRLSLVLAGFELTYVLHAEEGRIELVPLPPEDDPSIQRAVRAERAQKTKTKPGKTDPGDKRYSLKVENQPLGAVLKTFAQSLEIEVVTDDLQPEDLKQRVTFQVDRVSQQALFDAAFRDTNLRYVATERGIAVKHK